MSWAAPARVTEAPAASTPQTGTPFLPPPFPGVPVAGDGDYADDLTLLSPQAAAYDRQADAVFSYCVRNTATYECLSYDDDGAIRRTRKQTVSHGTAFAYRRDRGDTLLLTNDHVASEVAISNGEEPGEAVPAGCKKTAEVLRIVDNETDGYEKDDIPLVRVVTDPQLDVAVLRAHTALRTMPWKIGRSAALKERNVVEVRGFPLGAFRATNVGKVVSAYDHDDYKTWDHDDFVIDALLSAGNSGSPVLALSRKTGELELVGIYHAGYTRGSALNVVVGIDQVRDLMTTLKRTVHAHADEGTALDAAARRTVAAAAQALGQLHFPFGALTASVSARVDGRLVFAVFGRAFPAQPDPIVLVEDETPPGEADFGKLGRVIFASPEGARALERADLDADAQAQMGKALDALRRDAVVAAAYRTGGGAGGARERFDRRSRLQKTILRTAATRVELVQGVLDLVERLAPRAGDQAPSLAELLSEPPPSAAAGPAAPALVERDAAPAKHAVVPPVTANVPVNQER